MKTTALIPVDYENGFAHPEIWELYVQWWEKLTPYIIDTIKEVKTAGGLIIPTRDMHPEWHISFCSSFTWKEPLTEALGRWEEPSEKNFITYEEVQDWTDTNNGLSQNAAFSITELKAYLKTAWVQAMWPDHCKVNTPSSEYYGWIESEWFHYEIKKGYKADKECYSGFGGVDIKSETPLAELLKGIWISTVKILWLATDYCVKATALDAVKNGFKVELLTKWIASVDPSTEVENLREMREAGIKII